MSTDRIALRRRLGRPIVLLVVLLVLLAIVVYRYRATPVEVAREIRLLGNIDVRQVNLSFKGGGRIEELSVDEGDAVVTGQKIATLDQRYFEDDLRLAQAQRAQSFANLQRLKNGSRPEEIEQAEAQHATAKVALTRAEQDFERSRTLVQQNSISVQEFESNKAVFLQAQATLRSAEASRHLIAIGPRAEDVAAAQAQYDAADAQVCIAQRRLADAVLVAPSDGVVLTRAREVGAIVNAGETLFALTLISPIWVRTYVGEPDLGNVQPGMSVTVKTDGDSAREYAGRIGFVSPTAEFTPKAVETRELRTSLVYRLRIVIEDADSGLRQGMPVTVSVKVPGSRKRTFNERILNALGIDGWMRR